jgi:hypothetical protein
MSEDANREIRDHFTARARDLTPAAAHSELRALYAPVSPDPEVTAHCESAQAPH